MSRQREANVARIDHVMAVGLSMGELSISGGRKKAPVGTKPAEPKKAGNQRLWRAMMEHRKLSKDDEFRKGVKMETLPNIDVYEVRLEWLPVSVTNVEDVQKTRDVDYVIMSCVRNFGESTSRSMHYSDSLLISKDQPGGFYNKQFVRLYPRGPQQETLLEWYLKESLKLINYVPPSKELKTFADNQLHIAPPRQLATVTNDEFYQMSFDWNRDSAMSKNLRDVATAIQSGKVLGSDSTFILRTYQSTDSYHTFSFWQNLSRGNKMGAGSYNKVYVVTDFPEILTERFSSAHWTGQIVIRESKPRKQLEVGGVLKEMYLTGYASHYELGPRLLASYYLTEDNKNTFADVSQTISASVAWNGNCSTLLETVAMLDRPTEGNGLPSDFCKKFGELFVDLAKRAADVGLFHGDIKPANMLFCTDDAWENALDSEVYPGETAEQKRVDRSRSIDSLKICMTDFDTAFCHLLPPQDRECSKNCIVLATALMFMAFVRCFYGDGMWRNLRDGMLMSLLGAIQPASGCKSDDDAPCKYLTYTLVIEKDTIRSAITNAESEEWNATNTLKDIYIVIFNDALRRSAIKDGETHMRLHERTVRSTTTDQIVQIVTNLLQRDDKKIISIASFPGHGVFLDFYSVVAEFINGDNVIKEKLKKALKSVERTSNRRKYLDGRLLALKDIPEAMRNEKGGDFAQDYNGQKLEASQKWQRHISHYIAGSRFFSESSMEWEPCLKVEKEVSLFDQVFDYALLEQPKTRPNDKSTKRKLDNVTNPVNPDSERTMAPVHASNLKLWSQKLFEGKPSERFHYVETAMKSIVTTLNDVGNRLTYIAQLHSVDTSPDFIPALLHLNNYVLNQPSTDDWVYMQEKVVTFLHDVFVVGLHGVVDRNRTFRHLDGIDNLYTNLGRFGDNRNAKMGARVRAGDLQTGIRESHGVPLAVTTDS